MDALTEGTVEDCELSGLADVSTAGPASSAKEETMGSPWIERTLLTLLAGALYLGAAAHWWMPRTFPG